VASTLKFNMKPPQVTGVTWHMAIWHAPVLLHNCLFEFEKSANALQCFCECLLHCSRDDPTYLPCTVAVMDLVMQFASQNTCSRVVDYFNRRNVFRVFPEPFAEAAVEVGPLSNHHGPCLVLFSNMQINPMQFNAWLQNSFVERPCVRVFWLPQATSAAASR